MALVCSRVRIYKHGLMMLEHYKQYNDMLIKCLSVRNVNYSRNFCSAMSETSIFETNDKDEDTKNEYANTKTTELYNKQEQYRSIIHRVAGSDIYGKRRDTKQIGKCTNINELKTLYKDMHNECEFTPQLIPSFHVYSAFMEKALELEPDFFWGIFEELKEKFLHQDCVYRSKDLCVGKLFNTAMFNAVKTCKDKKVGLKEMFRIYEEFKTLCSAETNTWHEALPYYPMTLTRIIACCMMTRNYGRAKQIIDDMFENRDTFLYDKKQQPHLWNSILNYYAKTQDLDNMEVHFKKMTNEYNVPPDDVTFNIRINAFAKNNDMRFESIFSEYIETFKRYPKANVFATLLNGYSCRGDIVSCIDVLKLLLSKSDSCNTHEMTHSLPTVNFTIFVPIFKVLMQKNVQIEHDYGWKLVEYLLAEMKKVTVEPNEIIYGMIFTFCGTTFFDVPSMDKLMLFYNEMIEKYNLKPQQPQLRNVLKSGLQYFESKAAFIASEDDEQRKCNTLEKFKFVKWWKQEMDKYNVSMNNDFKHILIDASCIACLHDQ